MSSRDHGDARQAVDLLARSVELAQTAGSYISIDLVDRAAEEIERDKYADMIRTAPALMQAAMTAIILTTRKTQKSKSETGEIYEHYRTFCQQAQLRPVEIRAFRESLNELDLCGFIRTRILSKGTHGRSSEVILELDEQLVKKIYSIILLNFQLKQEANTENQDCKLRTQCKLNPCIDCQLYINCTVCVNQPPRINHGFVSYAMYIRLNFDVAR